MRALVVLVGCLLVVGAVTGVVVGQEAVTGSPDISVYVADDEVGVGQSTVELQLVNRGGLQAGSGDDRPTTATGVTVSASVEGPITVETDTVATGAVTTQAPVTAPVRVTVPDDAEPGTYDLDVTVEYAYTGTVIRPNGGTIEERAEERFDVTLRVPDEPRFAVEDVETDAQVGGDGSLFVTVRNEGTEPATDARSRAAGDSNNCCGGARQLLCESLRHDRRHWGHRGIGSSSPSRSARSSGAAAHLGTRGVHFSPFPDSDRCSMTRDVSLQGWERSGVRPRPFCPAFGSCTAVSRQSPTGAP